MPTTSGKETISERITRLTADLNRARLTVARAENNGASNSIGGTTVTEIAYDRARDRVRELERQIAALEARLTGSARRPGMAQFVTRSAN